jgi:hypothetical protein
MWLEALMSVTEDIMVGVRSEAPIGKRNSLFFSG